MHAASIRGVSLFPAWLRRPIGAAIVVLAVGAGGLVAINRPSTPPAPTPTPTPDPSLANLFVDSDGGSCAFSSTKIAYNSATACAGTSAAYTAANSASATLGATVAIRAGSYSNQTIPLSARTGADIAFATTNGAVTISGMWIAGDKNSWTSTNGLLKFDSGVDIFGGTDNNVIGSVSSGNRTKGVTFDGVKAMGDPSGTSCAPASCGGRAFYISNAQDLTFRSSDIGYGKATCGNGSSKAVDTPVSPGSGLTVDNVLFDGDAIHDYARDSTPCAGGDPAHTECMFLMSVQNWTIRNSKFSNCAVYSISLGRLSGDPDPDNVTIENNTFEPSDNFGVGDEDGFSAIVLDHVDTRYGNLTIRNNSMAQKIELHGPTGADVPNGGYSQTVIESNIIVGQACNASGEGTQTQPTYRFNVMPVSCGTGDTVSASIPAMWTTTSGLWDFHLQSGAAAIGAASTTAGQFTTTDIGGHARDSDPDAGAYERGSGS